MQKLLHILSAIAFCAMSAGNVRAQQCPAFLPRNPMPKEAIPAVVPIPGWDRLSAMVAAQEAARDLTKVRLVFLGDSITQGWEPTMWNLFWGDYNPLNLGVSGDLTQGVLWRLHNGQWPAALKPDLVVLLIGTNNASWGSRPENTALGIGEIIRHIQANSPGTRILLLGILPRGATNATPERPISQRVNDIIKRCADNKRIFFAEPGNAMVDGAGRVSNSVMFDYLHPTMVGYAILGGSIYDEVRHLIESHPQR